MTKPQELPTERPEIDVVDAPERTRYEATLEGEDGLTYQTTNEIDEPLLRKILFEYKEEMRWFLHNEHAEQQKLANLHRN